MTPARRLAAIVVLAAFLVQALPVAALAGPSVGTPTATPDPIPVGVETQVVVTAVVTSTPEQAVIPAGVRLQRIDEEGDVVATLGTMRDDGLEGDAQAGDGVFTLRFTVAETTPGALRLRVSAPFLRTVRRLFSETREVPIQASEASPPLITSAPATVAVTSVAYTYAVSATDPQQSPITFDLVQAPDGMTISSTGQIRWTPTTAQVGDQPVEVRARSARGTSTSQRFTVRVLRFNLSPTITSLPVTLARTGEAHSYQ